MKIVFLSCSLIGFVSAVLNCCSDWFILQGEKIRSEKVGMVLHANLLISTSAHIFRAFARKIHFAQKIRLVQIRLDRDKNFDIP